MTTRDRWHHAQRFERAYQEKKAAGLQDSFAGFAGRSLVRAAQMSEWLSQFLAITPLLRILEVGAGPHGSVYFLNEGQRFAIDPLAVFYRQSFAELQADSGVKIICAQGEHLPFPPSSFDLVISQNVLDHMMAPQKVIEEICRVLRRNGTFLLEVNVSGWPVRFLSRIHERCIAPFTVLKAFGPHPHCFSSKQVLHLIKKNGFEVLFESTSAHALRLVARK